MTKVCYQKIMTVVLLLLLTGTPVWRRVQVTCLCLTVDRQNRPRVSGVWRHTAFKSPFWRLCLPLLLLQTKPPSLAFRVEQQGVIKSDPKRGCVPNATTTYYQTMMVNCSAGQAGYACFNVCMYTTGGSPVIVLIYSSGHLFYENLTVVGVLMTNPVKLTHTNKPVSHFLIFCTNAMPSFLLGHWIKAMLCGT